MSPVGAKVHLLPFPQSEGALCIYKFGKQSFQFPQEVLVQTETEYNHSPGSWKPLTQRLVRNDFLKVPVSLPGQNILTYKLKPTRTNSQCVLIDI